MRCLDSGVQILAVLRPDGRVRCGGCGRLLRPDVREGDPNRTRRLPDHGSRARCPVCRSDNPLHHISDHSEAAEHGPPDGWLTELRAYEAGMERRPR